MAQRKGSSSSSDTELRIDISGAGSASLAASWSAFFDPGTAVIALPNWDRPRLMLSDGPVRERWTASRLYPAFRLPARLFRFVIRAAAALSILPSRRVTGDASLIRPILDEYLPDTASLSLLIGTSGAGQKLTAECRDAAGRPVGYLKYAEGSVATAQLRNEADVLVQVPAGAGPALLASVRWHRGLLQITRPVPGRPLPAKLPPPDALPAFTRSLERPETFPMPDHPWVRRTRAFDAVPAAIEALEGRAWGLAIQHGDLAAWNVRQRDDGLQAFDWEYGHVEGFPYLDLAHFVLQHAALIGRWSPGRGASEAADFLQSAAELSRAEAEAIVQLAAYDAYLNDPSPDADALQQWRQRIWRASR